MSKSNNVVRWFKGLKEKYGQLPWKIRRHSSVLIRVLLLDLGVFFFLKQAYYGNQSDLLRGLTSKQADLVILVLSLVLYSTAAGVDTYQQKRNGISSSLLENVLIVVVAVFIACAIGTFLNF